MTVVATVGAYSLAMTRKIFLTRCFFTTNQGETQACNAAIVCFFYLVAKLTRLVLQKKAKGHYDNDTTKMKI